MAAHLDGASPVGANRPIAGGFVAATARAGEALLCIGLAANQVVLGISQEPRTASDDIERCRVAYLEPATLSLAKDAIARCSSNSSTPLPALAALLSAALSHSHIIRSKALLKEALALSSVAGDNHLRALVLAVVGAQYVYTAPEHAMEVLALCETLGAGMGACVKKDPTRGDDIIEGQGGSVGNAALRLWVGERFLGECLVDYDVRLKLITLVELFKRAGKASRVQKQKALNDHYQSALNKYRRCNPF